MASEPVTVTIDESYRDRMAEVEERSRKAGLEVGQRLESVGVITGSIEPDRLGELRRVEGVADVEEQRTYQIAPPESEVQ